MKKIYTYLALLIVLLSSCGASRNYTQSYQTESSDITYQQFYDGLSPYGNWVNYQNYGYVWMPDEQGFRPYYNNGHWVYTNYGWTWVSNYNWGWAPFHYGRWLFDDSYGWMWVPGYEWAPAWVSWRNGGDYYGWAPLSPDLDVNRNYGSQIPDNNWAFVPNRYINSPQINNYYINRENNTNIINNTTIINNTNVTNNKTVYITGPSQREVENVTHETIRPVKIVQRNTPGNTDVSGSTVTIYKPGVKQIPQGNQQYRPTKVENLEEVKSRRQKELYQRNTTVEPTGKAQPFINDDNRSNTPSANTNQEQSHQQRRVNDTQIDNVQKNNRDNSSLPANDALNKGKENQQRNNQTQQNVPVEKPQASQQNIDRRNDEINKPSNANQNSNQQHPVRINPPGRARNANQTNQNQSNRQPVTTEPNNLPSQNNRRPQNQSPKRFNQPDQQDNRQLQINHAPVIKNESREQLQPKSSPDNSKEKN